jgi:hypothetical protein
MRKIYFLLLLAVFSLNLHCQLDNEMVLDSVVIYGDESKIIELMFILIMSIII